MVSLTCSDISVKFILGNVLKYYLAIHNLLREHLKSAYMQVNIEQRIKSNIILKITDVTSNTQHFTYCHVQESCISISKKTKLIEVSFHTTY